MYLEPKSNPKITVFKALVGSSSNDNSKWMFVDFRGPFFTSPLGANFYPPGAKLSPRVPRTILSPRGEVIPWGRNSLFAPPFFYLNSRKSPPLGVNERVNIPPRRQISPLGAKFTPRGKLHPWGQTMLLKLASGVRAEQRTFDA
jgi:hypothetical protein